jgi:hypothetical protein
MVPGKFGLSQVRLHSLLSAPIDCCLQRCTSFECCGLWEIKRRGGVTVMQNPVDAQHPSMPLNAINNMEVDHTVNIPDMPALLSQLVLEDGTGESILF